LLAEGPSESSPRLPTMALRLQGKALGIERAEEEVGVAPEALAPGEPIRYPPGDLPPDTRQRFSSPIHHSGSRPTTRFDSLAAERLHETQSRCDFAVFCLGPASVS
jgi:hypothetical protein